MKKIKIKKILEQYYKPDMVKSIMLGRARPSYEKMIIFNKHKIPFTAWLDIRSYMNDTKQKSK